MPNRAMAGDRNFFIGANTCDGFKNYMPDMLEGIDRVLILKGGPGTGKATLMNRIALFAEEKGCVPERYLCSSDPQSLDGVVLRELSFAIVDGTSPHSLDPKYPGAREEIINLGELWQSERLFEGRERIIYLSEKKSRLFKKLYKTLSACGSIHRERMQSTAECFDQRKSDAAAKRLLRDMGLKEGYCERIGQISAFSMNGEVRLPTYERLCKCYLSVSDRVGSGHLFLQSLLKAARDAGHRVMLSRNIFGEPEAVMLPYFSTSYIIGGDADGAAKLVNTERFLLRPKLSEKKQSLKFLTKVEGELKRCGGEILSEIKEIHFELEGIYGAAMDYSRLDSIFEKIKNGYLEG